MTAPTDARTALANAMSEAALQFNILDSAKTLGWLTMHVHDSRREVRSKKTGEIKIVGDKATKGWPDLVLCNPRMGELVFAELKQEGTDTTPEQDEWLAALRACGQRAVIWRPSDWVSNRILRVLEGAE